MVLVIKPTVACTFTSWGLKHSNQGMHGGHLGCVQITKFPQGFHSGNQARLFGSTYPRDFKITEKTIHFSQKNGWVQNIELATRL